MLSSYDYVSIGSLGFAQLGSETYHGKIEVEKQVINAFYSDKKELRVPEEFRYLAKFKWNECQHDFGFYYDFQIIYDRLAIELLEDSDEEEEQEKHSRFFDWVNLCETSLYDHEEELLELMNKLYYKEITMEVVYKNIEEKNQGLKAV